MRLETLISEITEKMYEKKSLKIILSREKKQNRQQKTHRNGSN